MIELVEFTDPCCSWAWGTEPKLRRLQWRFGAQLDWRKVMGGLLHDTRPAYEGMTVTEASGRLCRYWSRVSEHTDMPYPARLQWPPLTSHRMGRAVRAAGFQGRPVADRFLRTVRESVFVVGRPPDTWERLLDVAMVVPGLDTGRFAMDLRSEEAEAAYELDWQEARRPNEHVRRLTGDRPGIGTMKHDAGHDRFAFPTVVVRGRGEEWTVPGWMPYEAYEEAVLEAGGDLAAVTADPSPGQAVEHFGLLAPKELAALTGSPDLPSGARTYDWGAGEVALSEATWERWREAGWVD